MVICMLVFFDQHFCPNSHYRSVYRRVTYKVQDCDQFVVTGPSVTDLASDTSIDFLEKLLGGGNFLVQREVDGEILVASVWEHCLACEFPLRREALKWTRAGELPIQESLLAAVRGPEQSAGQM